MKLDRNGYAPSIMDTEPGIDYLTKSPCLDTVRHEIYFGVGNRKISKANGFWVNLSPISHKIVHSDSHYDNRLKIECYQTFLKTHSRDDFKKLIGRYYDE